MTRPTVPGLHHVSAIARDPAANVAFYTETLGLRLVKRTVNFDEPFVYHLYYGDETGRPGTLLTFFSYPREVDGRVGTPQPSAVALSIPEESAEFWYDRLAGLGIDVDEPAERFGETVVAFRDHDGLPGELVGVDTDDTNAPYGETSSGGAVPEAHAIRDLRGVTLLSASPVHTAATLEVLGFELLAQDGERVRYRVPGERAVAGDGRATVVDLLDADVSFGREGVGTIHHVAVRAGDTNLAAWRDRLLEAGVEPTRITDRRYFESIYVREPGGILFEVSTDGPGVAVDELVAKLGTTLALPPWLADDREMIEGQLPSL